MKSKKKNNIFIYQGYEINAPFVIRLSRKYGKHDGERMIFWAVQYCEYKKKQGINIKLIPAIQSGIYKGWIFKLLSSEFESKEYIAGWIEAEIYGRKQKKENRLGKCIICGGTGKDWKTKTACKECEGTGRKLPNQIGEILKELICHAT